MQNLIRNRRLMFDATRVAAAGGPVCCEVMTNVLYSLSRSALRRPSLTSTIVERMYDEKAGVFRPLVRRRRWSAVARRRPTALSGTCASERSDRKDW